MKHGDHERDEPLEANLIGALAISSLVGAVLDCFESDHGAVEYCAKYRCAYWRSHRIAGAFGDHGVVVELRISFWERSTAGCCQESVVGHRGQCGAESWNELSSRPP